MDAIDDKQKLEIDVGSTKLKAENLVSDVDTLLITGFGNKKPTIPPLARHIISGWEKTVMYMPIILIILPLITATTSAIGLWLWNNEILVFINFFNAIPGAIEAIAVNKAKSSREKRDNALKEQKRIIAKCTCYMILINMKKKLNKIVSINFPQASEPYKKSINDLLDDMKDEWDSNKVRWQGIIFQIKG